MFTKEETLKVKGIAILLLVFHHMYRTVAHISSHGVQLSFMTAEHISQIAFCFRICVYIFAILTAYGVTLSFEKSIKNNINVGKFLIQRYIRLMAPFWFTLVVLYIVYALLPGVDPFACYQGNVKYIVGDFLGILDMTGKTTNMFNGVFWYMNFAIIEIVLIPLIYFLVKRFGFAVLIFTSIFWEAIPNTFHSIYGGDYIWYLFAIELGVLLAHSNAFDKIKVYYEKLGMAGKILGGGILLVSAGVFPYFSWFKITNNYFGIRAIFHTVGAVAAIFFSYLVIRGKILTRVLSFLGKYSADMFLIHTIVFTGLSNVIFKSTNILVQYILCVLICLAFSIALSLMKKYTGYNQLVECVTNRIK